MAADWKLMQRGRLIRIIFALCLSGATVNHLRSVMAHGWLPEGLPWPSALYWSSLTFLDPLAAVLLFVRPRLGIALTSAIIISDVVHNLWFMVAHPLGGSLAEDVTASPFMVSQLAFLLFVAVTAPLAWSDARPDSGAR